MVKLPCCSWVKLLLGFTCLKATSVAASLALLLPAAPLPFALASFFVPFSFDDTGTLRGIEPFFLFCSAQAPLFAPLAISCAE